MVVVLGSDLGVPEITIGVFCDLEKLNNGSGIFGMSQARGRRGSWPSERLIPSPGWAQEGPPACAPRPRHPRGAPALHPWLPLRSVASECSWSCLKGERAEAPLGTSAALR